mgnify:CR=1 FL=1
MIYLVCCDMFLIIQLILIKCINNHNFLKCIFSGFAPDFYVLINPVTLAGIGPADFESRGEFTQVNPVLIYFSGKQQKHSNCLTTVAIKIKYWEVGVGTSKYGLSNIIFLYFKWVVCLICFTILFSLNKLKFYIYDKISWRCFNH